MFFRTFILPLPLHPNRMRAAAINAGSVSLRRVKQRVDDRSRFYARTMAACRRPKSFLRKMYGDGLSDVPGFGPKFACPVHSSALAIFGSCVVHGPAMPALIRNVAIAAEDWLSAAK